MKALFGVAAAAAVLAYAPAAFAASPVPWCGTQQTPADRLPEAVAGAQLHVIYAVPTDGTDASAQWAPLVAGDMAEIDGWWRAQDPSRAPRFDLYPFPSCAPGFGQLDLSDVRLASTSADLRPLDRRFDLIVRELQGSFSSRYKKYVVYFDGPVDDSAVCGQGGGDFTRGPSFAVVYLHSDCGAYGIPSSVTAAHELLHALGALPSPGPPNACPGDPGHPCDSPSDLLYPRVTSGATLQSFVLDYGRDDYYGHSGSWPDLQDSAWLYRVGAQSHLTVAVSGTGTVTSDAPGVACPGSCDSDWDAGAVVTLSREAAVGQRFAGWSGACSGTADCSVTMDAAKTVTAAFVPDAYPLRVKVVGRGKVLGPSLSCPSRCTVTLGTGSVARLRAVPAKGWRLKGWSGVCTGARSSCTAPVNAVTTARATFVKLPVRKKR